MTVSTGLALVGTGLWLAAALGQLAPGVTGALADLPLLTPASLLAGLGAGIIGAGRRRPAIEILSGLLRLTLLFSGYAALGLFFPDLPVGPNRWIIELVLPPALFAANALALLPLGRALGLTLPGLATLPGKTIAIFLAVNAALFALLRLADAPVSRLAPALVFLGLGGSGLGIPRRGQVLNLCLSLACLLLCLGAGWRTEWGHPPLLRVPITSETARALLPPADSSPPGQDRDGAWTGVMIDHAFLDFAVDLDPIRLEMESARAPRETATLIAMSDFYRLPFRLRPPGRALIVNSGLGNSLAAGQREGWQALEVQEHRPGLLELGREHPERPYQTPGLVIHRVAAPQLLARRPASYDLIYVAPALANRLDTRVWGQARVEPLYTRESIKLMAEALSADGILTIMISAKWRYAERRIFQALSDQFGDAQAWTWHHHPWDERWTIIAAGPGSRLYRPRPGPGLTDCSDELRASARLEPASVKWPFPFCNDRKLPFIFGLATVVIMATAAGPLVPGGSFRNLEPASALAGAFLAFGLMMLWGRPIPPLAVGATAGILALSAMLAGRHSDFSGRTGSVLAGFGLAAPTCLLLVWLGSGWPTVAGVVAAVAAVAAQGRKRAQG